MSDPNFADVSLLLHFNGADASTTFTDSSSNGLTVTANGNAQLDTSEKKFGTASGYFDGAGDYLTCTLPEDFNQDFTIEGFYYPQAGQDGGAILDTRTGDANTTGFIIYRRASNSNRLTFGYWNGFSFITAASIASMTAGQWWYYLVKRVGSTVTVYLDGVTGGNCTVSSIMSNKAARIGTSWSGGEPTKGWLDEMRITSGLARAGSSVPTEPFPDFAEGTSVTATATPASVGITPGTGSATAQRNIIATATPASVSVTPGTGRAFVRIPAIAIATPASISITPGTGRAISGAELNYPTYRIVRDSYRDPIFSRGKVILSQPLEPGQRLAIERKTPITQLVPFTRDEPFSAEGFEYAMDKITFIQQEIEGHACDCRPKDAEDDAEDYYYDQNPECAPYSCSALVGYFGVWDNLVWTTEPSNDDFPFPSSESGAALGCTNTVFGGNFNKTTAGASLSPDYCDLTSNWCLISAYAPGIREPGFITTGVLDENTISVAMVIGPASGSSRITGTLFNNQHTLRFSYNGVGGNNVEARVQVVASGVDAGAGVFTDTKITLIIWHAFGTGSHYNQEIVIGDVSEPLLVVVKGNISDPIIGATTIKYAIDAMLSVTGKNFGTQTVDYSETITRVSGGTISGAFSVSSRGTWIAQAADLNMYGIHVSQDGSEIDTDQARLAYLRNFTDYESPDYCIFPKD